MHKIIICLLALFVFSGTVAYAGSNHSHGPTIIITEAQAIEKATSIVKRFVKREKIDSSWAEVAPSSSVKKQMEFKDEWVITFDNAKIEDKAKQTLYVFINLGGEYIAANYTGK